jgi:protein ImuA
VRSNPRSRFSGVGLWPSCPNRNGESLLAVPEGQRPALLENLRRRIAALEGRASSGSLYPDLAVSAADVCHAPSPQWTLGAPEIDRRLAGGLDAAALHEVKSEGRAAAAGDWAAALGFALRLAVRRLKTLEAQPSAMPAHILWCWPAALSREVGLPCGQGLAFLGLEPSSCLLVETQRASEALWAMEEGLKSADLALVIGVLPDVGLTPARRLSLAAGAHDTPCLIVTDAREPAAGSTATRWRIGARASAAHPFEAGAPGAPRYGVALERCRERLTIEVSSLVLEWSDETHRFRVAPRLAHRADGARVPAGGAG